ncbi:MAG: hypothetical protein KAU22_05755 [Desulfuromonadales bacterium]|nr:hypothetical protein [Desulfuromonadales bacterium]
MTENKQQNNDQDEVRLYEKFVTRTEELLENGKKTLDETIKRAGDELITAGNFTKEQAEKVSVFIKRDIQHAVDSADAVKEAVDLHRIAVGAQSIFSKILSNTAETLSDLAQKSEQQLEFKTGEITSPGSLTCKNCGEVIHMKKTAKIPPCPKCHKTFCRKSY